MYYSLYSIVIIRSGLTVVISFNSFPKTFHQRIMYIWLAIYQSALLQGSYCHFNLIAGLYSYMFIAFIRSKRHLLVIFFTRVKQWWLINKKIAKALLMVTIYQLSPEVWPWCVQSRLILTKILILRCVLTILTYLVSFLYWYVCLIKRCSLQLFTQKFIIY